MSEAIDSNLDNAKDFTDQMVKLHTILCYSQHHAIGGRCILTYPVIEFLRNLIECMTNIDTCAEIDVFNDLVSCYPKLNYVELTKCLK